MIHPRYCMYLPPRRRSVSATVYWHCDLSSGLINPEGEELSAPFSSFGSAIVGACPNVPAA